MNSKDVKMPHTDCKCPHCQMLANGVPENVALAKMKETMEAMIAKNGFMIHVLNEYDVNSPTGANAHTHGIQETFGQLDLQLVIPVSKELTQRIFLILIDEIKNGAVFVKNEPFKCESLGYSVNFALAQEAGRVVHRVIMPDTEYCVEQGKMAHPYSIQWDGTY